MSLLAIVEGSAEVSRIPLWIVGGYMALLMGLGSSTAACVDDGSTTLGSSASTDVAGEADVAPDAGLTDVGPCLRPDIFFPDVGPCLQPPFDVSACLSVDVYPDVGPCLSIAPDVWPDEGDVGPCLSDVDPDTLRDHWEEEDVEVHSCLGAVWEDLMSPEGTSDPGTDGDDGETEDSGPDDESDFGPCLSAPYDPEAAAPAPPAAELHAAAPQTARDALLQKFASRGALPDDVLEQLRRERDEV